MIKISRKYKEVSKLIDKSKFYSVIEAIELAKKTSITNFDSTVEVIFKLNVDPRYSEQQIYGTAVLPKGTGKMQRILLLTNNIENYNKKIDVDFIGNKDLIDKIEKENWFDYDVIVATPDIMPELGKIGKLLGPKGLMPNSKIGTVTIDVFKAVNDIKKGKVNYRVDKNGNVHLIIGKVSFEVEDLKNNYDVFYEIICKEKPSTVKKTYIKNIFITTTMGPVIKILV